MKYKLLIKFYFGAERLNDLLDGAIMRLALSSAEGSCAGVAERITEVIGVKDSLNELWRFLDGVMAGFTESDAEALKRYGLRRGGRGEARAQNAEEQARAEHRALVKFARRAGDKIDKFSRQVKVLKG